MDPLYFAQARFEFAFGQADLLAVVLHGSPHLFSISQIIENGFATSPWLGFESCNAFLLVALDLLIGAHHTTASLGSDLTGRQAVGFEQDHTAAGAKGMARAMAKTFFQGGAFVVGQGNNQSAHRGLIINYF